MMGITSNTVHSKMTNKTFVKKLFIVIIASLSFNDTKKRIKTFAFVLKVLIDHNFFCSFFVFVNYRNRHFQKILPPNISE
jgi:hypothetical protein